MQSRNSIETMIIPVRRQNVVIDADLARIYGVHTRALNQAVKRNKERFPADFVFQLTVDERANVITKRDHLSTLKFSKSLPFAFTEHGAAMTAMILNSPVAVAKSVDVIRAFVQIREQIAANAEVLKQLAVTK